MSVINAKTLEYLLGPHLGTRLALILAQNLNNVLNDMRLHGSSRYEVSPQGSCERFFHKDTSKHPLFKKIPGKVAQLAKSSKHGCDIIAEDFSITVAHRIDEVVVFTAELETSGDSQRSLEHRSPGLIILHEQDNGEPDWRFSLPLTVVMKHFKFKPQLHSGYIHSVHETDKPDYLPKVYAGITKRHWLERMREHVREIKSGGNKLFHKTCRQSLGKKNVVFASELVTVNRSYNEIMNWEEQAVGYFMESGTSLNMIPGGFKGVRFLHELALLAKKNGVSLQQRDDAISRYEASKQVTVNPLIRALWDDAEYAKKVICGPEGRLSPEQVRQIRTLSFENKSASDIALLVNAKNTEQVRRVIAGATYSRILQ
tara:strand:- start:4622 stop:5734 length:1113 start_codon:yes stop_codon:yes gene_type:complete